MKIMLRILLISTFCLISTITTLGQEEVITTEYNEVVDHTFTTDGEQLFIQFEGEEGDVVYLLAEFSEIVFDPELDIDLRDSVGRSIGTKEEHFFSPIILAELPSTSTYTAVISFTGEESTEAKIIVGLSGYLGEEPLNFTITDDGFIALFGVKVEERGDYRITFSHLDGNLSPSLSITNYNTDFIAEDVIQISGERVKGWSSIVELDPDGRYIGIVGSDLLSIFSVFGLGEEAEISITMEPVE